MRRSGYVELREAGGDPLKGEAARSACRPVPVETYLAAVEGRWVGALTGERVGPGIVHERPADGDALLGNGRSSRRAVAEALRAYLRGSRRQPGDGTSVTICVIITVRLGRSLTRWWPDSTHPGVRVARLVSERRRSPVDGQNADMTRS